MTPRIFPIQSDTACKLKWSWNTLRLHTGATSSCHRVQADRVTAENFDTFHNTPKKITDRQLMIDGQWPTGGCEYCKNIEDVGGFSDRQLHLRIPGQYPAELDSGATILVSPTILEVYLDNVCNMSCLYCWDGFSSKIEQENIRFGRFEQSGVVIDNYAVKSTDNLKHSFWAWMDQHSTELHRLHILGGEPFFQRDFVTCLEFLEHRRHPQLEFNVVSNLMVQHDKFVAQIERIKHIVARRGLKRFDLTASIDCWGPEQEYVRYGLDFDKWKQNFEYVANQKWITLNINQTISGLTVKTIPALLEYVQKFRPDRPIGHYMSTTVETYDFLHPKIFGADFFKNDIECIINSMPEDTWSESDARKYLQGIADYLTTCTRDQQAINQLAVYLTELDRRRGTNWRSTFPWLVKEVTDVL